MDEGSNVRFARVCARAELARDALRSVEVEGRSVALADVGGELFAVDEMCTHSGGPLSEGALIAGAVQCPWHGARFELSSGNSVGELRCPRLRTYPARERDGHIEVGLPA